MANNLSRPKYRKVAPTPKLDEIARRAKVITHRLLAKGRDTRVDARIKIRK